jgi:perosamine synthetase
MCLRTDSVPSSASRWHQSGVAPVPGPRLIWRNCLRRGRGQIFRALRAENIGVNVHYIPVHQHPYYREQLGHSGRRVIRWRRHAYERLISLPMFHGMTDADVGDVVRAVSKVISSYAK